MRTTPMKRSRNSACARTSGPVVFPTTPVSRSTVAVAQRRAVLVGLLHEAQPHAGRFRADARDEIRPEILDEAFAGPQRERPDELPEVELLGGAQHRLAVLHELADPLAQLERPRRGNETAPGPDQQRIARRLAQPRQRPAHRRRAEPQPLGGARDAAFREQHIERDEQVEIGCRHAPTIAPLAVIWRQTHE